MNEICSTDDSVYNAQSLVKSNTVAKITVAMVLWLDIVTPEYAYKNFV